MKVLIADFDLFSKVGGGQTFYRRLIETNPNINFYYLIKEEKLTQKRPKNAQVFAYPQRYIKADLKDFSGEIPLDKIYRSFLFASNIAMAISNNKFDIIECPDYQQYGMFLEPALRYFQVNFNKIILSLHGTISASLKLDWYADQEDINSLDFCEKMQYSIVDLRYGISKDYLEEWQNLINIKNYYLHPLSFLELPPKSSLKYKENKQQLPSLNFIGRKEKRKGADIFINLVSYLPQNIYSQANIIGSDINLKNAKTANQYLQSMIDLRLSKINLLPAITKQEIEQIFSTKSITFLPSRADTLNLIALESLFSGCPTIIGNGAGVCRFLEDNFPQIPFIKLDVDNLYNSIPKVINILQNYDSYRQQLLQSLQNIKVSIKDKLNLINIYEQSPNYDEKKREKLAYWYEQLINHCQGKQFLGKATTINLINNTIKPISDIPKKEFSRLMSGIKSHKKIYHAQLIKSIFYPQTLRQIINLSERNEREIDYKLYQLKNLGETINPERKNWQNKLKSGYLFDRVKIWKEIARLETIRGNNLLSTTYKIRIMRVLEEDLFNDLDQVLTTLNKEGYSKEAQVLKAMYNNYDESEKKCLQILKKAYKDNLNYDKYLEEDYDFINDQRKQEKYQVSVIVSLYNAADKLFRFLQVLKFQTLLQKKQAEVILIDSGSPDQEYKVLKKILPQLNIPIIYARTKKRETIQSAWNRGILLSKSPYITFLGVDEMIIPETLEILSNELNEDSSIDWIVGNSLVTEVDKQGNWLNDIMLYNRNNYNKNLVYLDTCYLTYVGGLYRKNIHSRFGYYDSSFRGAGDTEFKNRILPHIKCKIINQVLGVFWNYPDARTTQSYTAEIEDLRAWYLHRTLAGVKYAFENQNVEELERLFYHTLAYRKSFYNKLSTDIDYGYNLIEYLREKKSDSPMLKYEEGIKNLLNIYSNLEKFKKSSNFNYLNRLWQTHNIAKNIELQHQNITQNLQKEFELRYDIFNDNRFEQHSNIW